MSQTSVPKCTRTLSVTKKNGSVLQKFCNNDVNFQMTKNAAGDWVRDYDPFCKACKKEVTRGIYQQGGSHEESASA